jgi:hypothetical protein
MIKIIMGKGFHLTFDNGLTISVQIGSGNYCENYNNNTNNNTNSYNQLASQFSPESKNAEVAIWKTDGGWITKEFFEDLGDDVAGYVNTDEIADLIYRVKNWEATK